MGNFHTLPLQYCVFFKYIPGKLPNCFPSLSLHNFASDELATVSTTHCARIKKGVDGNIFGSDFRRNNEPVKNDFSTVLDLPALSIVIVFLGTLVY